MNSNDCIVSLDIGTSSVRVVIGEYTQGSLNVIGVGTSPSNGMKKGAIVDIDSTVQSIRQAVDEAERMVEMSIESVFVGISGNHIQLQPTHGVVAVSSDDREIEGEDISRVLEASKVIAVPPERDIIDIVPNQYIVDGLDSITDPRGMVGVRLEMDGTVVTGSKTNIHNITKCIQRAGLSVSGLILQPLATSMEALSTDEKSMGVVLVDIGAGQMTVSMFEHGVLQNTGVIPVGGDYIVNDLSIGLRVQTDEALKIQHQYGCAFVNEALEEETFDALQIGAEQSTEYSQVDVANIIEPRLEEMFDLVLEKLADMGCTDLPSGGFVLTGGVVNLPGVSSLAKEVFECPVRIAYPQHIGVREPQYTANIGIIQYAYQHIRRHAGTSSNTEPRTNVRASKPKQQTTQRSQNKGNRVTDKVKSWLKEFI